MTRPEFRKPSLLIVDDDPLIVDTLAFFLSREFAISTAGSRADCIALLRSHHIDVSMSDKGSPTQNAVVERFMRTLKEEHVNYAEYANLDDARQQLQYWLEVEYMTERIHSSLGYLTPAEYEAAAANQPNPP